MLDGFEELKICVGYELDGERIDYLPAAAELQARVSRSTRPWRLDGDHAGARVLGGAAGAGDQVCAPDRGADRLPGGLLSTSPERDDTILVTDPFAG